MPWRRVGTVVVVVLLVGLLVPVAGTSGATSPTDRTVAGILEEDSVNVTDTGDATEETTVEGSSGPTTEIGTDAEGASVEEVAETGSRTTTRAERVTETTDGTVDTTGDGTETTDTASDGGTTEAVREVGTVASTETMTATESTETVERAAETVQGETVDEELVVGTTEAVERPVDGATDTVDGTGATEGVANSLEGASETVDGTAGSVNETLEDAAEEESVEDRVEDVTGDVDRTTGRVNETLESVEEPLASTTETLVNGSRELEIPYQGIDETSTARGSVDEVASGSGETTAPPPTVEAATVPPDTTGSIVRRAPGIDGYPEGALPIGGAVGALALLGGAFVHRGAVVANSCPDALLRGVVTLRRAVTYDVSTRVRPWRFLSAFRYSRFDDSDPLEHEERDELYRMIREVPGTNLSSLADEAGVPLSTVRHHLRVLQREGLVDDRKTGGKRRFVPRGTVVDDRFVALDDPATARVLDALERRGPASVSGLAEELDRDPSTVTHHLQDLEEAALVERHREGRTVLNQLTPKAQRALDDGGDLARGDDHLEITD